ncbi:hypothetical protein Dsin_005738 [Dipteronia sinensis]|uniref:ATP-dependent DNA helicase n=1 Tax=Dipteronia sinensis TaxID=43782 RepID=A0AAE0EEZ5_9ROSI|nr:hypothetical protein Dsin_005738 [Dipteronia sinensis]
MANEEIWKMYRPDVYVHSTSGERFYLRMLLNIVKGVQSFEKIRIVNGVTYETYKATCYALGLLDEDKEWHEAIVSTSQWSTGSQLHQLFVTCLLFCDEKLPTVSLEGEEDSCWIKIPDDLLIPDSVDHVASIVSSTYPDLINKYKDPNYLRNRGILTPTNQTVDEINSYVLNVIPG